VCWQVPLEQHCAVAVAGRGALVLHRVYDTDDIQRRNTEILESVVPAFPWQSVEVSVWIKVVGHVVEDKCERGSYDTQGTRINFAVPSCAVIAQYKPAEVNVPDEVPPGIIRDAIKMRGKSKTYVLSMD